MIKDGFDQNSRRAALSLENEILSLNGDGNTRTRLREIRKYLPQIFARKIEGDKTLMQKSEEAKDKYSEQMIDLSVKLNTTLAKCKNMFEMKEAIRSVVQECK